MALPIHPVTTPSALAGTTNGQLPGRILVDTPGQAGGPTVRLLAVATRGWRAMSAAARADGIVLKTTSLYDSYRPYGVQESTFRARYTTTRLAGRPSVTWNGATWWQRPNTAVAAIPGTSNHGKAIAVDIGEESDGDAGTESISDEAVAWLVEHADEYGYSAELQSEPWHWRWFLGDTIPPAVLAYEQQHGGDEDMPPKFVWCENKLFLISGGFVHPVGPTGGWAKLFKANGWTWDKVMNDDPSRGVQVTPEELASMGRNTATVGAGGLPPVYKLELSGATGTATAVSAL